MAPDTLLPFLSYQPPQPLLLTVTPATTESTVPISEDSSQAKIKGMVAGWPRGNLEDIGTSAEAEDCRLGGKHLPHGLVSCCGLNEECPPHTEHGFQEVAKFGGVEEPLGDVALLGVECHWGRR